MNGKPIDISAIERRHEEVLAQIEDLREEAEKLEAALEVIREFATPDEPSAPKLGPARPEGIPSLYVMTATVVREAGDKGLKAREIVDEISKRFWPGVQPQQILPQVYKFVKNGRLRKTGERIFAPKDEAPAE